MKLPILDDLIEEQLKIYDASSEGNLFVVGPPGSGKTTMAVHRTQFLKRLDCSVVLITRNRMLAALATQLGDASYSAKTMSSFFTGDFSDRFGFQAPQPHRPFYYDWPAIMARYEEHKITPKYDHLIIDEGQNLPAQFYAWAVRYGARNVSVFADEDQTTDMQRASIQDICRAPMPPPIRLTENHRNTLEIALVAEHFHHSKTLPPGIVRRGRSSYTPRLEPVSSWHDAATLIANGYANRGGTIGVIVRYISDALALQDLLIERAPNARVDVYTHKSKPGTEHRIKLMTPGITILTSVAVIGLEFNSVYLQDLFHYPHASPPDELRRLYMACARARDFLTIFNGPISLNQHQINRLPASNLFTR